MSVQNTGAGHAFPTGNPWKKYTVIATISSMKDKTIKPLVQYELKQTLDENHNILADTRILPGQIKKWDFSISIPAKTPSQKAKLEVFIKQKEQMHLLWALPIEIR